jgi:hypothetical protein
VQTNHLIQNCINQTYSMMWEYLFENIQWEGYFENMM